MFFDDEMGGQPTDGGAADAGSTPAGNEEEEKGGEGSGEAM